MKRYIPPQLHRIEFVSTPIMTGTNIKVDPGTEAEGDGWTRRFDWTSGRSSDEDSGSDYFY